MQPWDSMIGGFLNVGSLPSGWFSSYLYFYKTMLGKFRKMHIHCKSENWICDATSVLWRQSIGGHCQCSCQNSHQCSCNAEKIKSCIVQIIIFCIWTVLAVKIHCVHIMIARIYTFKTQPGQVTKSATITDVPEKVIRDAEMFAMIIWRLSYTEKVAESLTTISV